MTIQSISLSFLLPVLSLLAGCDEQTINEAPQAAPAEASPEAPADSLAEALEAPPESDPAATTRPEMPTAGEALPVVMGETRERPDFLEAMADGTPAIPTVRLEAKPNGVISISVDNVSSRCPEPPSFFARLETDGDEPVIRLHQRPHSIVALCSKQYSAALEVGAVPAGRYGVAIGQTEVLGHIVIENAVEPPSLPGTAISSQYTRQEEANREVVETTIEWNGDLMLGKVRLTIANRTCGGESQPLWVSQEGTTLFVQMQSPAQIARCATIPHTVELSVHTSTEPTTVEIR